MIKKKLLMLFPLICGLGLVACNESNNVEDTYTVIWQNDNGDILEIDRNVKEGSIPTYDGKTPTKDGNEQYSYTFSGWDLEIKGVTENIAYTAQYSTSINKYTITWKNDNGEVLETDTDVAYGTIPSYDSDTPKKEASEGFTYVFTGWSPTVSTVKSDATYTAMFMKRKEGEAFPGIDPVLSENKETVQYGFYPQTHVNDENLIATLNTLEPSETNGWYSYNGEYYMKEAAKIYNSESYIFDDGTAIVSGSEYWFKCEPIEWKVLSDSNGRYFLLSTLLLDAHNFYKDYANRTISDKTIYANNYEQSDVRAWLNNEFFNTAFALNNTYIQEMTIDNSAATFNAENTNPYICNNTNDKVYLPSYQDYLNADYGFDSDANNTSTTRVAKTTDYVRTRGAWCNTKDASLKYNGSYWTRSPSSEFYYAAWNVNSGGYLSNYAVDGNTHCVRPCITINAVY